MSNINSVLQNLSSTDQASILAHAKRRTFKKDQKIFSAGDDADYIYFIDSGHVAIVVEKFTTQEIIKFLGPGDYFGEMAVFSKDQRNATVVAQDEVVLMSVEKDSFLSLMRSNRALAEQINAILAQRNEELALKENLLASTGIDGRHLHVSIKGDPSLRESALSRARYESIVDKFLPQLAPCLGVLLLERCVYQLFLGFNNGEVHTSSVFDPFNQEIHPANKLLNESYLDRHFPRIAYDRKADLIRRLYETIQNDKEFEHAPDLQKKIHRDAHARWQPVTPEEIRKTLSQLPALRRIPNFFLRTFTMSIARDAIRLQFNCDGTHIVSSDDYITFLEENLEASEAV
jgi:CRP-like cAMP-binding protein